MGLPLQQWTLEDYMAWEETQVERHEFYRGEIYPMVGAVARHNRLVLNLATRIDDHLLGTPCQVFTEGMKLQLGDDAILYPDVMVTCNGADAGSEKVATDPVLVIEVLSPSTRGYDQRDKFALYRTLASLKEFVLIDPDKRRVELYTAADAGKWLLHDQTNAGALTLESIDLAIPFERLYRGIAAAS